MSNRITFVDVLTRDKMQILDVVKVADVVVCCFGPECTLEKPCFDDRGYDTLTCLRNQGLPIVLG